MNAGLLRVIADLKNLLFKRNSSITAFQLQDTTPNSIVGGNARGVGAVDLQMLRTAATQVASGDFSTVFGRSNTASGTSSVAMGNNNTATANQAVALGNNNSATGAQSVALGQSNTVTGASALAMGSGNIASVNNAVALGDSNIANGFGSYVVGNQGTANSITNVNVYGFNDNAVGQTQQSCLGVYQTTTNATTTRLTANAGVVVASTQLALRNNSVFSVTGKVVARDTTTNDARSWEFEVLIKRGANAAATTIVGTPTITSLFSDTAANAWVISVTADTTNGALAVNVTGEAGKTIRWVCVHESTEVA